jgi:hypothetical protein
MVRCSPLTNALLDDDWHDSKPERSSQWIWSVFKSRAKVAQSHQRRFRRWLWHFRIRIKRSFQFQLEGQWRKVSSVRLQSGQAYFTAAVSIGKTKPYSNVYLAFAHDRLSDEDWVIVSDEPTTLQSFA